MMWKRYANVGLHIADSDEIHRPVQRGSSKRRTAASDLYIRHHYLSTSRQALDVLRSGPSSALQEGLLMLLQ
jgi:hypothetical protein